MVDEVFFDNFGPFSVEEIIKISGAELRISHGDFKQEEVMKKLINSVEPLDRATEGDLTFLHNKKYASIVASSHASICILQENFLEYVPSHMIALVAKDPYLAYAKVANAFYPSDLSLLAGNNPILKNSISPKAIVSERAIIGKNVSIGPNAVIESDAIIGDGCRIEPNAYVASNVVIGDSCVIGASASISHAIIGNFVKIYPNVNVGQDGFGFAFDGKRHLKVPQLGRVVIEDDVEIGAGTCIDRGSGHDTVIGKGTRIDNLVQIGHNVKIGENCIIISQTGIAGSTKIDDFVVIGGQVGIAGHLKIGKYAQIAAKTGVGKNVAEKEVIGGYPAMPIRTWHRQTAMLKKLVEKNKEEK